MNKTLLTSVAFDKHEFRMYCNNKPVENIIIYNETGKYFNFHHGFIDILNKDFTKSRINQFCIDIVRDTKECDLSIGDNFLLEEDDPILDKVYTLYIFNGRGIYISNLREVRCLESIDSVLYTIHADITVRQGKEKNGSELENSTLITSYGRIVRADEKKLSKAAKGVCETLNNVLVMTDNKEISSLITDCLQIKSIHEV